MSFGASNQAKAAQNNLAGTSNLALNNLFPAATGPAKTLASSGVSDVASGANFFRNVLGGNREATSTMLAPDIDRIRQGNQQNLMAANTLMPRGGGRSGALFNMMTQPNQQIQGMFNNARAAAAPALAGIGSQELGSATGLFGVGNAALGSANTANQANLNYDIQNREQQQKAWQALGQGLFGLATTPFGGSGLSAMQRLPF